MPDVGSSSRSSTRPRVDLPEPDSPTSPTVDPASTLRSTPSTARTCPTVRRRMPRWMGKCFTIARALEERGHFAPFSESSSIRMQRARCCSPAARSSTGALAHSGIAYGQRGWNRQPVGIAWGSGTTPGIDANRSSCAATWGIAASRPFRVRVLWAREQVVDGRLLHHLARVHHHDARAEIGDHAEVVGDEDHRHPEPRLERSQQVEDLRLHGDVECGRGLVGDQEARLARERECEQGALAHPARQLVGIVLDPTLGVGDADEVEQLDARAARFALLHLAVQPDRVDELGADGEHGIEAGHRILEDHGDVVTAHARACRGARAATDRDRRTSPCPR